MKKIKNTLKLLLITGIILSTGISSRAQFERMYYAVEIDGVLCGYATSDISQIEYNDVEMLEAHDTVHLMLKALGQDMDMQIISRHVLQPETYDVVLNRSTFDYESGNVISTQTEIFDDYALRTEFPRETADTIWLKEKVIFDNPLSSPYLIEDFFVGGAEEKTYHVYDYIRGLIVEQQYTLLGEEGLFLAGKDFNTMLFNIYNTHDGTNTRAWVNLENGMTIQFEILNRKIYMAESTVVKQISTADLDNSIFAKVDENISNFTEMSYLKVKADIKSAGEAISVESLNFPGQKFEGTVFENHIQGIFEIEPILYNGEGAPAFPTSYEGIEKLKKYLEPEIFIESDHPDIIARAEKITDGAEDSWDAAIRLSKWVGKEIRGAVPGGTTAINTLRVMEGECGSHSRLLTAFCRAVGIPARLSIGCMYSPWYGGSFGQHAWTEVYMGEDVGWIAIDATILEFDYVDAGHIKLGEGATFHPESMEILDYRIGDGESMDEAAGIPADCEPLIGPYTDPKDRNVLEVIYDGGVALDIRENLVLALHEPDEKGRRYAKLTDAVYFIFPENESGEVDKMIIVEKLFAMKDLDAEISIDEETPSDLKKMVGPYVITQIQKEFTVVWHEGQLSMMVPDVEDPRPLEKTDIENRWRDPVDKKEYVFVVNDDATVRGMNIFVTVELNKGATASWIIDKTLEEEGMVAAVAKFTELWNNRALDLDHTEGDLNKLGYKYLGEDRIEEALMVFKLNVDAFPQSWNVYDSYGEALMKNGDIEEAIESYQKSITLNPENENGIKMLEEIKLKEQE